MLTVVVIVLVFLSTTLACGDVSEAVVTIEGCSGVCVDSKGIVLTAKHCDLPQEVTVRFKQRIVKARRVFAIADSEGPVAYDCEGDGYPSLPVASTAPRIGEKLWSFGYPLLNGRRELRQNCGPLLRWGTFKYAGGDFNGNVMGFPCSSGWSGGPLLNSKGEVCGLLSSSDDRTSVFISSAAVREVAAIAKTVGRTPVGLSESALPDLLVFGTTTCSPCLQFKSDLKTNAEFSSVLRSAFELIWIDTQHQPDIARQYAVEQVPVFLAESGLRVEGYTTPESLLLKLGLRAAPEPRSSTLIRIRNSSGRDLRQFEVLGIDAPIFDPQDAIEAFRREVTFHGVVPDHDEHEGLFVVLQEPLRDGAVGLAVVVGLTIARLHDPEDGPEGDYADVRHGEVSSVRRRKKTIAPIVWADYIVDDDDLRWVVIHLNPQPVRPTTTTTTCSPSTGHCLYEADFDVDDPEATHWVLVLDENRQPVDRCAHNYSCQPPTPDPTVEEAEAKEHSVCHIGSRNF